MVKDGNRFCLPNLMKFCEFFPECPCCATIYFPKDRDAGEHCVDRGRHRPGVLGAGPVQHAQGRDGA